MYQNLLQSFCKTLTNNKMLWIVKQWKIKLDNPFLKLSLDEVTIKKVYILFDWETRVRAAAYHSPLYSIVFPWVNTLQNYQCTDAVTLSVSIRKRRNVFCATPGSLFMRTKTKGAIPSTTWSPPSPTTVWRPGGSLRTVRDRRLKGEIKVSVVETQLLF